MRSRTMSPIFLFLLLAGAAQTRAELFTALVDLKKLLNTGFISYLDDYLEEEVTRLEKIEESVSKYKQMQDNIPEGDDAEKYLSNPVNSFLLIKSMTKDWQELKQMILEDKPAQKFIKTSYEVSPYLPQEEDLTGAVDALLRLQDMYQLEPSSIAKGEIKGSNVTNTLSAADCFELGKQSYVKEDFYHTVQWMQESLNQYNGEEEKSVAKEVILDYLAYSTYMEGNVRRALSLTNELLSIDPSHARATGNKQHYEAVLKESGETNDRRKGEEAIIGSALPLGTSTVSNSHRPNPHAKTPSSETYKYEYLCRQDLPRDESVLKRLSCSYFTNDKPFLFLQPMKLEVASASPKIYKFHDILSDDEIFILKSLATPRLHRATIQDPATGKLVPATYRISKSAWLRRREDPVLMSIWSRVEALTSLNMNSSEDLQVVNYGIGGHYDPHFDFARKEETASFGEDEGNRIATILFYLSDVDAGGATVFPDTGARILPEKRSAVFWWNLKKSGEGDYSTRHAACPVLAGSKWVANFWVHERGQEFRHPCGLKQSQ